MSMASELVKELRKYAKGFKNSSYGKEIVGTERLLIQAADTIEEPSAKVARQNMERSSQYYGGGWISVNDRLPETNVNGHFSNDVLVAIQWDDGDITIDISYYDSKSTNKLGKWSIDCFDYHVIAWKPLPPAYEPKEDKYE